MVNQTRNLILYLSILKYLMIELTIVTIVNCGMDPIYELNTIFNQLIETIDMI
jgi:hypothetical protein